MNNNCNNVISLKQYGPTCWFNSILMALLYSDESRKLLLKKSKEWNKKIEVFKTISYILHNKYLRTDQKYKDYLYFDKIRPEYILKQLYKYNKKKFIFDPIKKKGGYKSALYIRKLYKLLGVKVLFLDYNTYDKKLYYSLYNNFNVQDISKKGIIMNFKFKSEKIIQKYCEDPDIIIIHIDQNTVPYNKYPDHYKLNNKFEKILNNLKNLNDTIIYSDNEYINDSILLSNWNQSIGGHSIAGITCKGDKYVYNGWTRTTIDSNMKNDWIKVTRNNKIFYYNKNLNISVWEKDLPENANIQEKNLSIPCELMKYNWNPNKDDDFCLNIKKCSLDFMSTMNDLCFSFNKGSRELIYIKKNKNSKLDIKTNNCPDGKVINPLTNRCIKIKTINKISKNELSKPEKNCPDGKILNPKSGRCIKIKTKELSKPEKNCPDGKILNPKSGRCIKIKTKELSKSEKNCPDGKILNPKSGRCIKIKTKELSKSEKTS